jgi:hypothetical protein
MQASGSIAYAGNDDALAGRFDSLDRTLIEYEVPSDSGYWGLIFFVGGEATRDPRSEFITLILRFKPMHSWAAVIANFV